MDKKGGLVLSVIILVVVFVAGALFGGPVASSVAQSPGGFSSAFVNAHECTRDGTCEVNKLLINDQAELKTSSIDGVFSINVGEEDMTTVFSAEPTGDIILGGDVRILGDLLVNGVYAIECEVFPRNTSQSGEIICQNNGYDYCLFAEYHKTTQYLDGLEACNGEVQVEIVEPYIGSCPAQGGGGGGGCGFNSEGVEPYYGVYRETLPGEINVLCCRS